MKFRNILFKKNNLTATVTINRPHLLNVINAETAEEITAVFRKIKNDISVRSVIIRGAGEKAFAAGADINEISKLTEKTAKQYLARGHKMLNAVEMSGKPVIAAINGYALGGGCELALACHIRIAGRKSKIGLPELKIGVIPGWGGNIRLPRVVGRSKALEMILTGEILDAEEAVKAGLINYIADEKKLMEETEKKAFKINSMPPIAVKSAIETIMKGMEMPFQDAVKLETEKMSELCSTKDKIEGTSAFLEKRQPFFKGK